jgi:hypothetical protein
MLNFKNKIEYESPGAIGQNKRRACILLAGIKINLSFYSIPDIHLYQNLYYANIVNGF